MVLGIVVLWRNQISVPVLRVETPGHQEAMQAALPEAKVGDLTSQSFISANEIRHAAGAPTNTTVARHLAHHR